MTRTAYYKWRIMKQLFTRPSTRHLAERGRDPARVGDDVDVGYAAARKRVDEVLEEGLGRRCPLVTCPRGTWLLAAAARRNRGWAAAVARRQACPRATAPPYGTASLSRGSPRRSPSQRWASSASTSSIASCTSWTRRRRPTSATKRCE